MLPVYRERFSREIYWPLIQGTHARRGVSVDIVAHNSPLNGPGNSALMRRIRGTMNIVGLHGECTLRARTVGHSVRILYLIQRRVSLKVAECDRSTSDIRSFDESEKRKATR